MHVVGLEAFPGSTGRGKEVEREEKAGTGDALMSRIFPYRWCESPQGSSGGLGKTFQGSFTRGATVGYLHCNIHPTGREWLSGMGFETHLPQDRPSSPIRGSPQAGTHGCL